MTSSACSKPGASGCWAHWRVPCWAQPVFYVAPPPYRARATVNVDFNLEEAWPEETDRQQFYYLERETRKLEEIAWSDAVMMSVAECKWHEYFRTPRTEYFHSANQPKAGWHFYADDRDAARAEALASAWALAFTEQAQAEMAAQVGLNALVRVDAAQVDDLPVYRSVSQSTYMLSGSIGFLALSVLLVLFVKPNKDAPGGVPPPRTAARARN